MVKVNRLKFIGRRCVWKLNNRALLLLIKYCALKCIKYWALMFCMRCRPVRAVAGTGRYSDLHWWRKRDYVDYTANRAHIDGRTSVATFRGHCLQSVIFLAHSSIMRVEAAPPLPVEFQLVISSSSVLLTNTSTPKFTKVLPTDANPLLRVS